MTDNKSSVERCYLHLWWFYLIVCSTATDLYRVSARHRWEAPSDWRDRTWINHRAWWMRSELEIWAEFKSWVIIKHNSSHPNYLGSWGSSTLVQVQRESSSTNEALHLEQGARNCGTAESSPRKCWVSFILSWFTQLVKSACFRRASTKVILLL